MAPRIRLRDLNEIFPSLISDKVMTYMWYNEYKSKIPIEIRNQKNRNLRTLTCLISCPWHDNYSYTWTVLSHLLHNLYQPPGRWNKYEWTLNKKQERIVTVSTRDENKTKFPVINPSGIDPAYYHYG